MAGRVLIAGASGVVGRAMCVAFAAAGWEVVGLSRRGANPGQEHRVLAADLLDEDSCRAAVAEAGPVSHLVYCATYEKPNLVRGWTETDHVEINARMLEGLMAALLQPRTGLRHVALMQGTKAYGAAGGFFKLPAKESDPRYLAPNFYYLQEDHLRALQSGADFAWTILRPQFVCGFALGSAMNGLSPIAVYAAISRELGLPLRFPGGPFRVQEATDSRLLAGAALWATEASAAANETFNIVNGDCFTWESLWPRIAARFGCALGTPAPARLARIMPDKAALWRRMVARHGLADHHLEELVPNWELADNLMGYGVEPRAMLLSGIKARQAGFADCVDSEEMFLHWLGWLQAERFVPDFRPEKKSESQP